jgi:hypothetical protein
MTRTSSTNDDGDVIQKERQMKSMFQAAVVAAAVLAVPALGLAAQVKPAATTTAARPAMKPAAKPAAKATVHSARGVVKSMDPASLVITEKTGKKKSHDVTFVLDSSTQKTGSLAVGSTVQVKYRNAASQHVATEVRAGGKKS